jgi:hypothetical protein
VKERKCIGNQERGKRHLKSSQKMKGIDKSRENSVIFNPVSPKGGEAEDETTKINLGSPSDRLAR